MSKAALIHYHGGKHRLADWIIGYMPQHKLYVEPFGGAAGVLLRKRPVQTEIYNDIDNRIFNVFKTIREQPDKVAEALRLTLFSRAELSLSF